MGRGALRAPRPGSVNAAGLTALVVPASDYSERNDAELFSRWRCAICGDAIGYDRLYYTEVLSRAPFRHRRVHKDCYDADTLHGLEGLGGEGI